MRIEEAIKNVVNITPAEYNKASQIAQEITGTEEMATLSYIAAQLYDINLTISDNQLLKAIAIASRIGIVVGLAYQKQHEVL